MTDTTTITDTDTRGTDALSEGKQALPEEKQMPVPARAELPTGAAIAPVVPRTIEEVHRLSSMVIHAGLAPSGIKTVPQVMMVIMAGLELGMAPMQALQSICLINGKTGLYGDGMLAVVRKSGQLEEIKELLSVSGEGTTEVMIATCRVKRDGKWIKRAFSKHDAQVAGLWGKRGRDGQPTPWITYPRRMLQMRARAFALRDGFADVLRGMASAEEQADIAAPAGNGGPAEAPPPPPEPGSVVWEEHEERPATAAD
jgi:hypothetical protein